MKQRTCPSTQIETCLVPEQENACQMTEEPPTFGSSRENGCTHSYVALEDICEAFLPKKTQGQVVEQGQTLQS